MNQSRAHDAADVDAREGSEKKDGGKSFLLRSHRMTSLKN